MKLELIIDICFIIFATVLIARIFFEVIPDHVKKYWKYQRQTKKDHEAGWLDRKWIWTFKTNPRDK